MVNSKSFTKLFPSLGLLCKLFLSLNVGFRTLFYIFEMPLKIWTANPVCYIFSIQNYITKKSKLRVRFLLVLGFLGRFAYLSLRLLASDCTRKYVPYVQKS